MYRTVKETTNHYYCENDLLGKGATCEVYKGISKSGEYRALKIFLERGKNCDIKREVTALKGLQHRNVIIFYSIETDKHSSHPVLVTELCENGSLQDVLNQPNFKYGLDENEFLLVFKHLVEGIRHLRQHGFVHRDIKPGNILRCIDEYGKSLYKLSDFGTARLLDDGDQFMSLCGTEEYLHPNLYNVAFLQPTKDRNFDAKVDLWSLGATLYHCATGSVPFKPYFGRNDKQAMYDMLTKRPDGAIGGIQVSIDEPIKYSFHLPQTSPLSSGLKGLITPLISALLEKNESKTLNFEDFFKHADNLLNKKIVTVLSVIPNPSWEYKIYMDPTQGLVELQRQLKDQTGISEEDQLLYFQTQIIPTVMATDIASIPSSTSSERPIILLSRNPVHITERSCPYLFEIHGDKTYFSRTMDMNYDIHVANMIGSHIHMLYRQSLITSSLQQHFPELEEKLRKDLKKDFELAKVNRRNMKELHFEMKHVVNQASRLTRDDDIWPLSVDVQVNKNEDTLNLIEDNLSHVVKLVQEQDSYESPVDWYNLPSSCSCRFQCLATQASNIINRMVSKRKILETRMKTAYDGLEHGADKKKLSSLKDECVKIWKENCLHESDLLQTRINQWSRCHIEASDKVIQCLQLLEDLRVSNLRVLQILRQESTDILDEESDNPKDVKETHAHRVSELKDLMSTQFPEIYQPNIDEVQNQFYQATEDQSMTTLIL